MLEQGSHDTPAWGQAFGSWWDEWGANGTLGHHPEWFALLPPNSVVNPTSTARRVSGQVHEQAAVAGWDL